MPSPTVLAADPLLAPIAGGDPAGKRPSILDRNKLKDLREDFDPERDLSEDERVSPQFAERAKVVPQWDKVLQFGTQFLTTTGKELSVALAVVEALTKKARFAGLRDGLKLLTGLCEQCWDRMHPVIDDPDDPDEVEGRVGAFAYLDDEVKTPFFPAAVRGLPLFDTTDGRPVSFLSMQAFGGAPPKVSADDFRQAVAAAGPDAVAALRLLDEDMTDALDALQQLVAALDAKAGRNAPGLGSLRKAVQDCQTLTREAIRLRGSGAAEPAAGDAAPAAAAHATATPSAAGVGVDAIRSRDEVYRKVNELMDLLEKFDPHSPVPLLIRRAIEMRDMKFPELVDRLNSEKRVLEFIRKPLGDEG